MRHFLLRSAAILACFGIASLPETSTASKSAQPEKPDFNGTWTLDVQASDSLEPLMARIGASAVERNYARWAKLKATFNQSGDVLTVATRGPGLALDETLYPDGRSHPSNLRLLGATCTSAITAWSKDGKELVVTYQITTKEGKAGQLIIRRSLINEGKTEVVDFTAKLMGDPDNTSARQIWPKQTAAL